MKLAEALQERADLNRRIEFLQSRLNNNVLYQEGEQPSEDPNELLKELNACLVRLEKLISLINLKNASTFHEGRTLTEMIAQKDVLSEKISAYRQLINTASSTARRARSTEIRILSAVNVRQLQKETDEMAAELRKLDNTIQQLNWTTAL